MQRTKWSWKLDELNVHCLQIRHTVHRYVYYCSFDDICIYSHVALLGLVVDKIYALQCTRTGREIDARFLEKTETLNKCY